jgi:hypothetical protein
VNKANQWLTLVANLGVIAGLAFLGFEIRQNTNIAKASAYRENVQDIAAWRELFITNPEVARLYRIYSDEGIDALDDTEQDRVAGLVNNVMGTYENAYFARRYEIIGDEEWLRFQSGACVHYRTAVENKLSLRFTTPGFRRYLEETCKSNVVESGPTKPGNDSRQSSVHRDCRRSRTALCSVGDLDANAVSDARALRLVAGRDERHASPAFNRILVVTGWSPGAIRQLHGHSVMS